jgi:hypothetical protein
MDKKLFSIGIVIAIIAISFVVLTMPANEVKTPVTIPKENQTECASKGQSICTADICEGIMPSKCCSGLKKINNSIPINGKCDDISGGFPPCMPCGDRICESPENECNCPQDCKGGEADGILYNYSGSWGDCPPDSVCHSETVVYYNGKITKDGTTYDIDDSDLAAIIEEIEESAVLEKECEFYMVFDYAGRYTINLNGVRRSFDYPECETELNAIDSVIQGILERSEQ